MKLKDVMAELEAMGTAQTKKTFLRHGAKEPFFGVKVGDMKTIVKKIKGDQALALELYATGNGDAQYLAGLVADGKQMTRAQLQTWAETASWKMISEYTVAWVACEHPEAAALAAKWIAAKNVEVACAGWNTYGALAATVPDAALPIKEMGVLLERVPKEIGTAPNRVRYCMNGYVIAVGTYVAPLADKAMATAKKLGTVEVDVGDTDCTVPVAAAYIEKARRGAPVAAKRKTVRC
jgi:3-methyladenine DNA glycosylase AlkD